MLTAICSVDIIGQVVRIDVDFDFTCNIYFSLLIITLIVTTITNINSF